MPNCNILGTLKYCLCEHHQAPCLDNVTATDSKNERTALHWSARGNDSDCTNILVNEGANIEALDNKKYILEKSASQVTLIGGDTIPRTE